MNIESKTFYRYDQEVVIILSLALLKSFLKLSLTIYHASDISDVLKFLKIPIFLNISSSQFLTYQFGFFFNEK